MLAVRPVRLTLSRRKGFDLQALSRRTNGLRAIAVTRPGPWGNPFVVGLHGTRVECVRWHEMTLNGLIPIVGDKETTDAAFALHRRRLAHIHIIGGCNLACFCPQGAPCHATTTLHHANPILFADEIAASCAAISAEMKVIACG